MFKHSVDTNTANAWFSLSHAKYEPELYPAVIYRLAHPSVKILVFVSGKLVFTGSKVCPDWIVDTDVKVSSLIQDPRDLHAACEQIYPVRSTTDRLADLNWRRRIAFGTVWRQETSGPAREFRRQSRCEYGRKGWRRLRHLTTFARWVDCSGLEMWNKWDAGW